MRRFAMFALALTLGAPACDDDSPTGPSSSGPIVFTAELRASNEVPAVSNAESNAQGIATITFSVPRDGSGNITGDGVWNVQAVVSGFTDSSVVRAAHIHNGPAGANAGIFIDTGVNAVNPIPVSSGTTTVNIEQASILGTRAQAVLNNPAGHYFNMHTPLNGGGAIRGQLVRVR
jgi:CHRD domain